MRIDPEVIQRAMDTVKAGAIHEKDLEITFDEYEDAVKTVRLYEAEKKFRDLNNPSVKIKRKLNIVDPEEAEAFRQAKLQADYLNIIGNIATLYADVIPEKSWDKPSKLNHTRGLKTLDKHFKPILKGNLS